MKYFVPGFAILLFMACQTNTAKDTTASEEVHPQETKDTTTKDTTALPVTAETNATVNDSLNDLAAVIAGMTEHSTFYPATTGSSAYQQYYKTFNTRWQSFDSSRISKLKTFQSGELKTVVPHQNTLFYPFSGPDILYANCFFPDAEKYVMIGLEPVGSLPDFSSADSVGGYFDKLNTSLNAILKFSFFRTISMSSDLKNKQVDGTLHVLLLFLKRNGHAIANIKPLTIDSLGNVVYQSSFKTLKSANFKSKGVEITFVTPENITKTVTYFSMNAADDGLKSNPGFVTYLKQLKTFTTYLKGASYLMHKSNFSIIRNSILAQSTSVVQDDSGIAMHYFTNSGFQWSYQLFGQYTRPIPMFSNCYQKDLDSLYKQQGSKDIGFGIGYNFRDKNSNFMVAVKQ
ncbi:MAG: hypothetical protein QM534_07270 [Sediminibacterium sp.]|nr:hypothetical protein [Sediminibacterium sp.]